MTQSTFKGIDETSHSSTRFSYLKLMAGLLVCVGLLSGCVSTEKYEAEKARALNFQRLLAQEEKRTGELNVKYQDAQRQLGSLQSQDRDLNAELDALRDQLNRSHEELSRVRGGGTAMSDDLKLSEPSISEFGLDDLDFKDSEIAKMDGDDVPLDSMMAEMDSTDSMDTMDSMDKMSSMDSMDKMDSKSMMAMEGGSSHTVVKGETLYRLSKQYGVTVDELKAWNNLLDNTIHVGQEIVISQ